MTQLERPIFSEGQILGANDLTTLMEYGRAQDARDRRHLHTWGIAEGLTLSHAEGVVSIASGMAIDSSGAQIVVGETDSVSAGMLPEQPQASGSDVFTYFPIFLAASQEETGGSSLIGRCSTGQTNRTAESYQIQIGRASEATNWDDQTEPSITEGPDDSAVSSRRVLLGFAVWDGNERAISNVATESNGVRPRFVGVACDSIQSVSGRITHRTKPSGTSGALMIELDPDADPALTFGPDDGKGAVGSPVFSVDKKGNVIAAGTIQGTLETGTVLVQSGIATDGVVLPLPAGVDETKLADGAVAVHVHLTPRIELSWRPKDRDIATVEKCFVDDEMRLTCLLRWVDLDQAPPVQTVRPGVCDYLVIASVPSS